MSESRKIVDAWIVDHAEIDDGDVYIACAIGVRSDNTTYLYRPEMLTGRQFKNRLPGCYAAFPVPEWKGATP